VDQIGNVRKAKIILKYWDEALQKEILEMETIVEKQDVPSIVRTTLRKSKGAAKAFTIEAQQWLDANEAFLMSLLNHVGLYKLEYPRLLTTREEILPEFYRLFTARQNAVLKIREYPPFVLMVY
jgi:hypothetical protein